MEVTFPTEVHAPPPLVLISYPVAVPTAFHEKARGEALVILSAAPESFVRVREVGALPGALIASSVRAVNVPETPPIVRVAVVSVELAPEEVTCIRTCCPLVTVPAAAVHAHPLMEYCPPVMVILDGVSIPATVIGAEVMVELRATPV